GYLRDVNGTPLAFERLRALTFGNGQVAGDANTLYFTAGIDGQKDGLFGSLRVLLDGSPPAAPPLVMTPDTNSIPSMNSMDRVFAAKALSAAPLGQPMSIRPSADNLTEVLPPGLPDPGTAWEQRIARLAGGVDVDRFFAAEARGRERYSS